jgi:TIR domain
VRQRAHVTNLNVLQTVASWLENLAAALHSSSGTADFRDARRVLAHILSQCLITQMYLVDALANASRQDTEEERELIQRWHSVALRLIDLSRIHPNLPMLGNEVMEWTSRWVSSATWSRAQNEGSLETVRHIRTCAQALLASVVDRSDLSTSVTSYSVRPPHSPQVSTEADWFDVFLAHSHQDKRDVRIIANALQQRGVRPWLDVEQVLPGRWFHDVIQRAIKLSGAAAIFIGPSGVGKWQSLEIRTFIGRCIDSELPVIPVLLPGVSEIPTDMLFLRQLNWVTFSQAVDESAMDQLEWGITGKRRVSAAP